MRKVALIILALFAVPSAFAGAIATYTFTGTASGTIGSTSFSGATLTVTASGPISSVTTFSDGYQILFSSSSFTVGGVGSGTFTGTTYVFDNDVFAVAGFGDENAPIHCCDLIDISDSDIGSSAFASYNLQSSIGPLGLEPTDGAVGDWDNLSTSLGAFTLTSFDNASFQATVGATPEPSALILFGLGLAGIAFVARRKLAINAN
ncbi:MAG: PEP-CTERM sorting domain-containing protein [Candidatus Acidiferrales bacterium]